MKLKEKHLDNYKIFYKNEKELDLIYKNIFKVGDYKFFSKRKSPFIMDCGSHIGISILYFKYLYPNSKILGFEPDPDNFEILKKNIKANGLKKIALINKALSDTTGRKPFYTNKYWSWGGSLISSRKNSHRVYVRTDKL